MSALTEITQQLHQVDAEVEAAGRAAETFLATHPDLGIKVAGGLVFLPFNAMSRATETNEDRKQYATLESRRVRLVERRDLILQRYAALKMEQVARHTATCPVCQPTEEHYVQNTK